MLGLMHDFPLTTTRLMVHAERFCPTTEIVSRRAEGDIHRYTFADMARRSRQLANALTRLGVEHGDMIGTIAWNGYRHMELYYGVPGMGAVYHTMNPRLSLEQLAFVINHAEDKYIFTETMFLPLLEGVKDKINVKGIVVLCEADALPESSFDNLISYEALIAAESDEFDWPELEENQACGMCYTSGTTGDPKGVLYSHRAIVLQAMATAIALTLTSDDVILPIVPMFHVNAWTLPFTVAILGTKFVLPGKGLDGKSVWELLDSEKVTVSAGVPTVWLMLFEYMEKTGKDLPYLRSATIGGAAAPRSMLETFRDKYNVDPQHAWGMTETTSLGTSPTTMPAIREQGEEVVMNAKLTQGHGSFGAEIKVVDDNGDELPFDGKTSGRLLIRGWAVASAYFKGASNDEFLDDGWFDTGDIATISPEGYMQITDRAKDVIKSGGEWISSIDLENAAMEHPDIMEAAVIGIPHPKWDERPLLIAVAKPGAEPEPSVLFKFLEGKVAKWWIPDTVIFVAELPHGATGKVNKLELRKTYGRGKD